MATPSARKRAQNVTLSAPLIEEAQKLDINISQACERGLAAAVQEAKKQRWIAENRDALAASNAYVAAQGLPLDKYRQF